MFYLAAQIIIRTEQEVRDTILGMFDSFSVESDSKDNFYNFVTDDYILYEMGKAMTAADFIEFLVFLVPSKMIG